MGVDRTPNILHCCVNNIKKIFQDSAFFICYLKCWSFSLVVPLLPDLFTRDIVSGQSDVWLHQSNRALVSFVCFTFYSAQGALVASSSCPLIGQLTTAPASDWLIASGAGTFWTWLGISINILPASTPQDISCILHTQD